MSRESFLQGLNEALGTNVRREPTPRQVGRYFASLSGDEAIAAYEDYASSFYVHITTVSRNPLADVEYPGGSCDRWQEITRRRRHGPRRIIDCEAYAFMAYRLLGQAGFSREGYQTFYLPTPEGPANWHIVAVLGIPESRRRLYIGGPVISRSSFAERHRVYPQRSHDSRSAPMGDTPQEAIENMMRYARSGQARELAPLPPRRPARIPPVMSE